MESNATWNPWMMKKIVILLLVSTFTGVGCNSDGDNPPTIPNNPTTIDPGSNTDGGTDDGTDDGSGDTGDGTDNGNDGTTDGTEDTNDTGDGLGDGDGNTGDTMATNDPPEPALLIFPYKNSECEEGSDVTDTESTVTFEWAPSANTDSYELQLTNLNTGVSQAHESGTARLAVRLSRGVPYEWSVISRSTMVDAPAQSETWRFYNQGLGIQNFVPSPAEAVAPLHGASLQALETLVLQWNGMDADGDIIAYDVYLDTLNPPTNVFALDIWEQEVSAADLAPGRYYWYVVTKDTSGNSSESQVFHFTLQ